METENLSDNPQNEAGIPPKKTNKGVNMASILSLLLILSVIVSVFFYWQNVNLRQQIGEKLSEVFTPTPIPTQTPMEEILETLADNKNGFSIKVPKMYLFKDYDSSITKTYNVDQQTYLDDAYFSNDKGEKILKNLIFEISDKDLLNWQIISDLYNQGEMSSFRKGIQNDLPYVRFTIQNTKTYTTGFAISNGQKTVAIAQNHYLENQTEVDSIFDKLIPSFEFIENSPTPTSTPNSKK